MSSTRLRRAAATVLAAAAIPAALVATSGSAAAGDPITSTAAAPVAAPGGVAGTDTTVTMTYGGLQRTYMIFVPNQLPAGPRPLIVALPYLNGTSASFESMTGFDSGAVVNSTLIAYPQGIGNSWNGGTCCGTARDQGIDDVGFLNAVLDDVEARYAVNAAHIAMGGFSNGGIMSYRYACSGSTRVQTFFIGSGDALTPSCVIGGRLAFLHVHGLLDTRVPWLGTTSTTLTSNGTMPSIRSTTSYLAKLQGCTPGSWTTSTVNTYVVTWTANGCPTGASFTIYTSSTMPHEWTSTAAQRAATGINETGLTWSFVLGRWANS